jgi:solute carrier family 35 (adenosine 3'-phospho 5'-phosphosulfate transporter), member B3
MTASKGLSLQFESLPTTAQFLLLSAGVFLFFGVHNYLQEAILHIDGFRSGVMLGYAEVLGVCLCSFIERHYVVKEHGHIAPMSAYPLLTACLMASSGLSNMSLNYINFPTKVVFRSCKLIPTMVIASVIRQKAFSFMEYLCAFAICLGLILFAAADWDLSPSFHPFGLALVSASVCADAILPNAQERLFRLGASRLEVTLFTNAFSLLAYTATTLLSGDLTSTISLLLKNQQLALYFTVYTFISYIAISMHMGVVKRFGGVAAVLVATGRKGMTLILSFLLFPKAYSWFYPLGGTLVLGGLLVSSLLKIQSKKVNVHQSTAHHDDTSPLVPVRSRLKHHMSDLEMVENGLTQRQ